MRLFLYGFIVFCLIGAQIGIAFGGPTISDSTLEKRLIKQKIYTVKPHDTLEKVAYKLFGHRSWWHKIAKQNKRLKNFKKHTPLPKHFKIKYLGPDISDSYVVKKNDTFTRVLEWKFGQSPKFKTLWKKYRHNKKVNIIRPGDIIYFGDNYEITLNTHPVKMIAHSQNVVQTPKITKEIPIPVKKEPTTTIPLVKKSDSVGLAPPAPVNDKAKALDTPMPQTKVEHALKTYAVPQGDTLRKIAYRVYGHKQWWKKLRQLNPEFKHYKQNQIIPEGKHILYNGPDIKDFYVVQKGDTLSRIAIWKFGNMDSWTKIFKKNKDALSQPDLIHPGERLELNGDGEIKVADTKKVLVTPIVEPVKPKPIVRKPTSIKPPKPSHLQVYFWTYFFSLLGVACLGGLAYAGGHAYKHYLIPYLNRPKPFGFKKPISGIESQRMFEKLHFHKNLLKIIDPEGRERTTYPKILKALFNKIRDKFHISK